MRTQWVSFQIALTLTLLLAGCTVDGGISQETSPVPITETITPIIAIEITETLPMLTEEAPVSTAVGENSFELAEDVFRTLNCEQVFCEVRWSGVLNRPIGALEQNTIDLTYPYASTLNGTLDPHHGVEFQNPNGTPVYAAQSGEVIFAGSDSLTVLGPFTGFYGNVVILEHTKLFEGKDIYTLYAHLSEIDVQEGQTVASGEILGRVGSTGAADGPHLHFEVRVEVNDYDHTVNPVLWFAPLPPDEAQAKSMLVGLIQDRYGNPLKDFPLSLEKIGADGLIEQRFYPKTYTAARTNGHPVLGESFAVPDIPPGDYRLALIFGELYEIYFTITPGSLGFINLQLD